jgi:hypothetical protein
LNFEFSIPSLPEPPKCIPNQLIQLTSNLPEPTISTPSVDKVLAAIEQGKADQVSQLDWIYCIHAKAQWDKQNTDRSHKTSAAIWKVAISNSWLQHQLLWRLALSSHHQQEQVLAKSLADSFDIFANSNLVSHLLPVQIVRALCSQQPGRELAKIADEQRVNQTELVNIILRDLPVWIPSFSQFIEEITPYFVKMISPNQQQVTWLLSCLNEMSNTQQINAVDYLLTRKKLFFLS